MKTKQLYLLKFVAPVVMMSLIGCTYKTVPRTEHEGPITADVVQAPKTKPADEKVFNEQNLPLLTRSVQDGKPESQVSVLKTLGDFVMNASYVENPSFSTTIRLRDMLSTYNAALLKLQKDDAGTFVGGGYLDRYMKMVLSGCDRDLQNCNNISFFKSDYRSEKILLLKARLLDAELEKAKAKDKTCEKDCLELARQYYQILGLAFDMKNLSKDTDLEFLYMRHARDYAQYFNSVPEADRNREYFQRHGRIFETIIGGFPADPSNPQFAEFVVGFKPWSYSQLDIDPFPFGTKKMFSYAAGNYLYSDSKGQAGHSCGSLNPDFKGALTQTQTAADKAGPSFTQVLAAIQNNQTAPFILNSLGIDSNRGTQADFLNEYFFMIDRLYRRHLGIDEVTQIWLGSCRDQTALLKTLDYYMRIQIVNNIVKTNDYMASIYAKKDYDSKSLMKLAIQQSRVISADWEDMLSRFDSISVFLGSQLKVAGNKDFDQTQKVIGSIRRNVKFLSVYPNMMMLVYFLEKADSKFGIETWWGDVFSIDMNTVVDFFFRGGISPWFRFGNDDIALNKIEMLYAYYFALNTGTFETFSVKKDEQTGKPAVNREMFFIKIMRSYLGNDLTNAQLSLANIRDRKNAMSKFSQVCEFEKTDSHDYSVPLKFDDLHVATVAGYGKSALSQTPQGFFEDAYNAIQPMRLVLEPKMIFVRTMFSILKNNLQKLEPTEEQKKNMSESQRQAYQDEQNVLKSISSFISSLEQTRIDLYNEIFDQEQLIGPCLRKLYRLEDARQRTLFNLEANHLREVYKALQDLQAAPDKDAFIQTANKKFGFTPDLDSLQIDGYRYTHIDLLYRMKRRVEDASTVKPVAQVEPPADVKFLRYYSDNVVLSFFDRNHNPVTEDDFVKSGMRYLNGQDGSYLRWPSESGSLSRFRNKTLAMIEIYKLGVLLNMPPERQLKVYDPQGLDGIVNEVLESANFVNISPEDTGILNLLKQDRKVPFEQLADFLINRATGEPMSVFEMFFNTVTNDPAITTEAVNFYKAQASLGYFLFSPDARVASIMRQNYRPMIVNFERIAGDFDSGVLAAEKSYSGKDYLINYALGQGANSVVRANQADGHPVFLSLAKRWDFTAFMRDFHDKQTNGYFRPQPGDPDCTTETHCQAGAK